MTPHLSDDLDDLLEPQDSNPENETETGFDELDSLLSESLASVRESAAAKAAKERMKRGGLSAAEQAADAERIRRWELAHEWRPEANAALFERLTCRCGSHSTIFKQLLQRQVHRHLRSSQRWQAVAASRADLPNEVIFKEVKTAMCPACASAAGFDLSLPAREWHE